MTNEQENPYAKLTDLSEESAQVLYELSSLYGFDNQPVKDQIAFLRGPFSATVKKSKAIMQAIHECALLLLLKDIDAMGQKVEDLAKEIDQLKTLEVLGG